MKERKNCIYILIFGEIQKKIRIYDGIWRLRKILCNVIVYLLIKQSFFGGGRIGRKAKIPLGRQQSASRGFL